MYQNFEQFDTIATAADNGYRWAIEDVNEAMPLAPRQGYHKDAYADGILRGIFANAPSDCDEIRIGMRVYFKSTAASEMFILVDWLHVGDSRTRQRLESRSEQVEVSQEQISGITAPAGWVMGKPPTRRNTTEFVYYFVRAEIDQHEYRLNSRTVQAVERRVHEAALRPAWA